MRSLMLITVALLSMAAARRMTDEDLDLMEAEEEEQELSQLLHLEEERQRPFCTCINPFRGTPNEYLGDPRGTCASTNTCYVPCNADCRDIRPARGRGRCVSALACQPRLLLRAPATSAGPRTQRG